MPRVVDIGGEGRHPEAWNVNPSSRRTCGPARGAPIPRLLRGRAEAIPLPDHVVDVIFVERTPLSRCGVEEIRRIARPGAVLILRHARPFNIDPHRMVKEVLAGRSQQWECRIGPSLYQETIIELDSDRA